MIKAENPYFAFSAKKRQKTRDFPRMAHLTANELENLFSESFISQRIRVWGEQGQSTKWYPVKNKITIWATRAITLWVFSKFRS